jgi:RNA polymerase sigma factor (sigma-70 family)
VDDRDTQAQIDAALVERARSDGDRRAFEGLVRRHQGLVRAQLRRLLVNDPATADDLAQETFVLAWRKLHQFVGDARFSTWLYQIAYSCFLMHRRRHKTLPADLDEEPAIAIAAAPELGLDLDAALRQVSPHQRAALLYCTQLGLSHDEAALVMNIPLGSVKTHVARGKARLRERLNDWAPHRSGDHGA